MLRAVEGVVAVFRPQARERDGRDTPVPGGGYTPCVLEWPFLKEARASSVTNEPRRWRRLAALARTQRADGAESTALMRIAGLLLPPRGACGYGSCSDLADSGIVSPFRHAPYGHTSKRFGVLMPGFVYKGLVRTGGRGVWVGPTKGR